MSIIYVDIQTNLNQVFFEDRQSNSEFRSYLDRSTCYIEIDSTYKYKGEEHEINLKVGEVGNYLNLRCYLSIDRYNEEEIVGKLLKSKKFLTYLKNEVVAKLCDEVDRLNIEFISSDPTKPCFSGLTYSNGDFYGRLGRGVVTEMKVKTRPETAHISCMNPRIFVYFKEI